MNKTNRSVTDLFTKAVTTETSVSYKNSAT